MSRYAVTAFAILYLVSCVVTTPINETDCPPNEEYYKCSIHLCYTTCSHYKFPPPCPGVAGDNSCGQPSCECKQDYLRNDDGVCIHYTEC